MQNDWVMSGITVEITHWISLEKKNMGRTILRHDMARQISTSGRAKFLQSGCEFSVDHIQIFWLLTQKDKWNNFSVPKTVKLKISCPLPVIKWFQNHWYYLKWDRWGVSVSEQSLGKYVVIKIMGLPFTEHFHFVEVCSDFKNTL